jgi:hypothetical protein
MMRHPARIVCILLFTLACGSPEPPTQQTFESREAAVAALVDMIEQDDRSAIPGLFGPEYADQFLTPDWDANRETRLEIAQAIQETHRFEPLEDGAALLVAGAEDWPFPIPLAETPDNRWRFDTEEGIEVIIDRRVGRDELSAIEITDAYVDAQIEYAKVDRDGDGVLEYAQRLASSEGKRDGLYWETGPDEPPSPFGPLVERAESYLEHHKPGDPIRGYYFRILTKQGPNPPGGGYDYIINGNMIGGFGLVAYPADFGSSGVMTFVVNHQGRVLEKDIGPFSGMDEYDPDDSWKLAEPD